MSLDHHDHRLFDDIGDSVCAAIENGRPTLRDRFAMAVIGDIYSTFIRESGNACGDPDWRDGIASDAYKLADAMMKVRAI